MIYSWVMTGGPPAGLVRAVCLADPLPQGKTASRKQPGFFIQPISLFCHRFEEVVVELPWPDQTGWAVAGTKNTHVGVGNGVKKRGRFRGIQPRITPPQPGDKKWGLFGPECLYKFSRSLSDICANFAQIGAHLLQPGQKVKKINRFILFP